MAYFERAVEETRHTKIGCTCHTWSIDHTQYILDKHENVEGEQIKEEAVVCLNFTRILQVDLFVC